MLNLCLFTALISVFQLHHQAAGCIICALRKVVKVLPKMLQTSLKATCPFLSLLTSKSTLVPLGCSVQQLQATNTTSPEVGELCKLVLKIFWSCTYMGVPKILLQEGQFTGWMTVLHNFLSKPVPQVQTMTHPAGLILVCCLTWDRFRI